MIEGKFSDSNELIFEIDFVAEDGATITVDALFDTGFIGWERGKYSERSFSRVAAY